MKKGDIILVFVFFAFIVILGLWCIDTSVSAMLNGGMNFNGLFFADPYIMYHFGLYLCAVTLFCFVALAIHVVIPEDK